jgi:hypothetical protein
MDVHWKEGTGSGSADCIISDFLREADNPEAEDRVSSEERAKAAGDEPQEVQNAGIGQMSSTVLSAHDTIRLHGSNQTAPQDEIPTERMYDDKKLEESAEGVKAASAERGRISDFIIHNAGGKLLARRSRSPFRLVQNEVPLPLPDNGLGSQSESNIVPVVRSNSKKSVRILSPRNSREFERSQSAEDMEFVACPHTLRVSRRSKSPERRMAPKSVIMQRLEPEIETDESLVDTPTGNRIFAFDGSTPKKSSNRSSSRSTSPQPSMRGTPLRSRDAPDPDTPIDGFRPPVPIFRRRLSTHAVDLSLDDAAAANSELVVPSDEEDHTEHESHEEEEDEEEEEKGVDQGRPTAGTTAAGFSSPILSRVHRLFPVLRMARAASAPTAAAAATDDGVAASGSTGAAAAAAAADAPATPVVKGKKRFKRAARRIMIVQVRNSQKRNSAGAGGVRFGFGGKGGCGGGWLKGGGRRWCRAERVVEAALFV